MNHHTTHSLSLSVSPSKLCPILPVHTARSYTKLLRFTTGVARLFCSRAKFENYFSLRAALFKIVSYDKVTTSVKQKYIGLFILLLTVFGQISGSRRSMLFFLLPEKGPRAAKISWRAALWPCLLYNIHMHQV